MNFDEYRRWLKNNANKVEREAIRVVNEILNRHQTSRIEEAKFFPRFSYKGIEFDLLIWLVSKFDKNKKLKEIIENTYNTSRLISVEFKETDIRKVIQQAICRKSFVDYCYIATQTSEIGYEEIFLLALFGIGWIIWDDKFAKIIIPARYYPTSSETIRSIIDRLLERKFEETIGKVVKERFKEMWKEWILKK